MLPDQRRETLLSILRMGPVVPVLIVDQVETAVPLARALVTGGVRVLEVTLRTQAALDVIRAIASQVEGAVVGVGTVRTPEQLAAAAEAGAQFAVSPGATRALVEAATASPVPWLPGTATPSEAMQLAESGFSVLKLFPAEAVGGAKLIASLASPLPDLVFCPTGGIDRAKAQDYLKLKNVVCVGGSWIAPADLVAAGDWTRIEELARDASQLR
ncbi:MAG TPA: bifunctional 4-hydroxy-2-oxoglutarate aldolase/2-dehydro-3-deoxy-phosphogluconate aldolase [Geminicoccus sp.]|jgi:2-dehydro-3-deoxyphosphogluconate aldolase/(4S)-4-hydroxy-2-oxoglutarate aldolase|uniref:bifunctional 4-hydroxy-2-oxoglutarate aldolase/2-dehydro-3-deoxy-phosphogluconate aldolase n=1 Tax=Geminicoccus sp. TaxID=2024832 RepID=UPI002E31C8CB|nr:bifunctional 4-hydroxy-2-oxoglutarate aldolase/2-dehydro-3-deoxy-phosphogluconate aldolase [Geminicoccus sp.]HEX2528619.1 bifunctional 4-hydroxy-2-oxoglutarate aldolase/2-dehydro-3-deoxy-phosphogluconate aldolase [Geminicoccus sp.]